MLAAIIAYKALAQVLVLVVTAAAAWRWGAGPEKAAALVMVVVFWLGDLVNHWLSASAPRFAGVETGHLVLDLLGFLLLLAIALFANRIYPLCMSVVQGVVVLTHLAAEAARTAPLAYSILSIAPSYVLLALLIGGLAAHIRRTRRFGPYRSWRQTVLTAPGHRARP